ncbi:MAG: hypothetical protein A2086_06330 [Spirochaetes bacterium GWD1_27_9]|nr:MAG: hypothetical protein A2Z98_05435 [Spirochaetes bacterium GWB1_27_13]OHD26305.1 MAG: hypothetical protein A2Y34_00940 [Spirochaetes bacterium GWC1_27_15]OHD30882.1 MAG: hypothetical protein A2086_06330 [Spirochaetes bacterium GWD1_27_9]
MNMIKLRIFVFFILLFLTFSNTLVFPKKRNPNIIKAEQLIKQRKFKEAKEILANEYALDSENEELIITLINKIEDEEAKIGQKTQAVTESLLQNDTKKAGEFLNELDKIKGDFNEKVKEIIKTTKIVNIQVTKMNNFYKYLEDGERAILQKDIDNALKSYKNAIDQFRIDKTNSNDRYMLNFSEKFNNIESQLLDSGIESKWIQDSSSINFNKILDDYKILNNRINGWLKIEDEFLSLKKELSVFPEASTKNLEYQAYDAIVLSYTEIIRNGVKKNYSLILDNIFNLMQNILSQIENGNTSNDIIFDNLVNILENQKVEYYSFYNFLINYRKDLYLKRSSNNIHAFIYYVTKKNNILIRYKIIKVQTILNESKSYYEIYKTKLSERELRLAEEMLIKANSYSTKLNEGKNNIVKLFFPYETILDTKYYKDTYLKYRNLNKSVIELNNNIQVGMKEVEEAYYQIKRLVAEGNDKFNNALSLYKKSDFENAKTNFEDAKDKFFEVLDKVIDKDLEKKIEQSEKYIQEIKDRFYKIDKELADNQIDNAKKSFYNEEYDKAKRSLDIAEAIYKKYNEESESISYYRERIATAIKIKSGTTVKPDDPAYDYITELFQNANNSYEIGQKTKEKNLFVDAINYIGQILIEKPYNEKARFLETKILKETDPKNFESRFQSYYDKAKAKLSKARETKSNADYADALLEFQQVLKFEKDLTQINKYILECKRALEFKKKELTEEDKNYAKSLITKAQGLYAKSKFREAYDTVNEAFKIWDEVPEGRSTRQACIRYLDIVDKQTLTVDNELKYRKAEKAYATDDFETAYKLTSEILAQKGQDLDKVVSLNKKADIKRKQ